MICRRCGNRIPEHLTTREYFRCPECGREFGTPPQERRPQYRDEYDRPRRSAYDDRPSAQDRAYSNRRSSNAQPRRQASRFEPESYEDQRYDDRYYDDESYYDDDQAYYGDEPYYDDDQAYYGDEPYYDDDQAYYGDEPYYDDDQAYYGDEPYYEEDYPVDEGELSDLRPAPRTMKLTTVVIGAIIAAIATVIVMYCVAAGLGWGEVAQAAEVAFEGGKLL